MTSVAVVGVGDMGSEMIPHLVAARFNVTAMTLTGKGLRRQRLTAPGSPTPRRRRRERQILSCASVCPLTLNPLTLDKMEFSLASGPEWSS
jgi:hypothetical protein